MDLHLDKKIEAFLFSLKFEAIERIKEANDLLKKSGTVFIDIHISSEYFIYKDRIKHFVFTEVKELFSEIEKRNTVRIDFEPRINNEFQILVKIRSLETYEISPIHL